MTIEAVETVSTIPPGWYSDPADPQGQRWWDGGQWTDRVVSTEPIDVDSDVQFQPAAPAQAKTPSQAYQPLQPLQHNTQTGKYTSDVYAAISENTHTGPLPQLRRVPKHNGPAWTALLLGAATLGAVFLPLASTITVYVVAVMAVLAIGVAVFAIRRHQQGVSTNNIAPVAGTFLALAGAGLMVFTLLSGPSGIAAATTGSVHQPVTAGHSASNTPDAATVALSRSELVTDVKRINQVMKAAKGKSPLWPASLSVDASRGFVTTATGKKLGTVPVGAIVAYSTSADGTGYTLSVSNPATSVGIRYSSATFTYTSF